MTVDIVESTIKALRGRVAAISAEAQATLSENERLRAEVESLRSDNAAMREALEAVDRHEHSSFFGADGEKNQRRSWKGVVRKVRSTLSRIQERSNLHGAQIAPAHLNPEPTNEQS